MVERPWRDDMATAGPDDAAGESGGEVAVGAMRMGLDDSPTLQMPVILVKPNDNIPLVIGILLIIGSVWFAYSAYSNLFLGASTDASDYEEFASQISTAGEQVTAEQVAEYFEELEAQHYFLTLGVIEVAVTFLLLAGGILLIRKQKMGVLVGGAGGSLALLDGFVGFLILSKVEAPNEFLALSFQIASGLAMFCGMLCMLIPALPMMLAAGRASLEQHSAAPAATTAAAATTWVTGKARDLSEAESVSGDVSASEEE